jgi:dTDP-4-amino-4,6-dideoxygalactose transaminase
MMQFIDLAAQQARIRAKIDARIAAVLDHGAYIMGPEVTELEQALSEFCGAKHALTCANGTDALQLALMALEIGKGDAVFCPAFTFAATAEVIPSTGATPVFVDIDPTTFNICANSLRRAIAHARDLGLNPAAVIAVDLFGRPADYDALSEICAASKMRLIADSAQGFGGTYKGRRTGTLGDIATTSFFPAKPLGCYGDGGAVFTQKEDLADKITSLRVHGKGHHKYDCQRIGMNSRLDTLQAAILCEKLAIFPEEIRRRNKVAARYTAALGNLLCVPYVPEGLVSTWAQYTLRAPEDTPREKLIAALEAAHIPAGIYYPKPLHQQTAYASFPMDPKGLRECKIAAATVFSLPMHPYLTDQNQDQVIEVLHDALT